MLAKQANEMETVADLSTHAAEIQSPQILLETVVAETQRRFDLYHCHIFLLDEQGENLQIKASGWKADSPHAGTHGDTVIPLNREQSLVAQAARLQQAVVVNDVQNDPYWLPNEKLPNTRSEMAVPMITGGRVLGVLDVQSDVVDHFSEQDKQIQLALASQTAVCPFKMPGPMNKLSKHLMMPIHSDNWSHLLVRVLGWRRWMVRLFTLTQHCKT